MKSRIVTYLLTMIAAALMSSCESDSDISLDTSSQTVMTAFIYKDSTVAVNVYGTSSYTDTLAYKSLGEIDVIMYVNSPNNGIYRHIADGSTTTTIGQANIEYGDTIVIKAQSEGQDKATIGRTVMLDPVDIENVNVSKIATKDDTTLIFTLTMLDPIYSTDYYQIDVRLREKRIDGKDRITPVECNYSDYLFYVANSTLTSTTISSKVGLFNDELFNGRRKNLTFSASKHEILNSISKESRMEDCELEILLYHHTEDYYNYMRTSLVAQSYILLPIFGISTIHSNITNGVGMVTGMSLEKFDIEITELLE